MKKITLLFVLSLSVSLMFSQGSFQLNFSGKEQSSSTQVTLQKVNIINLTRGVDTMLTVNPNTFQLVCSVGINELVMKNDNNFIVHPVVPNPFNNQTGFDIELSKTSNLQVSLYSVTGKRLAGIERQCGSGISHFTINASETGILFLHISDGESYRSLKLINMSSSTNATSEILYKGSDEGGNTNKSITANSFYFVLGDQLQFVGYAANYGNSTVYDSPDANSSYIFEFTDPFYRIIGHNIETSSPCFVDVMFSVEDQDYKGVDNLDNNNFKVSENGTVVGASETFRYIMKVNTIPYKLKTVLMIDNSASVAGNLSQIKAAAIALVNTIGPKQEFAIYSFSSQPVLLQDFTSDVSLLTAAINSITLGYASTNLYGSFITGVQKWSDLYSISLIQQGFLVLFTDGDDTQGSSTIQQAVAARGTKKAYVIGLGQDIVPANLNQLANPGPYYPVTTINQLEQVFLDIQQDIIKYANSFYWLNYMTPKRTGSHTLKIEVIGNDNTGTDSYYQGQFSASGFTDVFSGVYLNTTPSLLYGIDSVEINNTTPFALKAVTYWANEPPSYAWTTTNSNIVTIVPDSLYFNRAQLHFPGIEGGVAFVTVEDDANTNIANTKTLKVIAYTPPTVTTAQISNITPTTATGGGNVTGDGGMPVTDRGVCWSTSPNPTIADAHTSDSTGTGNFSSNITGLNTNTTYYVRAYATNSKGTSYGNSITFTTLPTAAPTVTTNATTNITAISATSGGNIVSDGGATVTARGVCWSTTSNPTTSDAHTTDGTGTGSFTSNITGLSAGIVYYVRAYATNSIGTSYGNNLSFTTQNGIVILTTTNATSITATTALSGGNITADGGATVTARGVCWSTISNPTTSDAHTNDSIGTGSFTSSITSLMGSATYYVRAFAINSAGTAYGNQISFTTNPAIIPTIITTPASNITSTTATSGGNVTSDGGATVTDRGVCWNISPNPTLSNSTTSNGTGSGLFTTNIIGLTLGSTYYVRAYATNSVGTVYGNEIVFIALAIGDSYQGGKVAYILQSGDAGYDANVPHGLIAAPSNQAQGAWGCAGTLITGADGHAIGSGNQNTIDIINGCSTAGIAARICSDLVLGGYSDWYLPSKGELEKLLVNQVAIGGFQNNVYIWSSTEYNNLEAYYIRFTTSGGAISRDSKTFSYSSRAVRSF